MSKTKASIGVVAATILTVATLFLLPFTPKIPVQTALVSRGDLIRTTLLEGKVGYHHQQPCLSLQAGVVSGVYVTAGQTVQAGQLLFSLDTSIEEEALQALAKALHEREQAVAAMGQAGEAAGVLLGEGLEWQQKQTQLRQSIASKQVRAQWDGIVGEVYVQNGQAVAQGELLGVVHSREKCVVAAYRPGLSSPVKENALASVKAGTADNGVYATLSQIGAPAVEQQTGQYLQQLVFLPLEQESLGEKSIGEAVTVELLCDVSADLPLIPLEAVGEGGKVWVVQEGVATPVMVDLTKRSETFAAGTESLLGQRVVLNPDEMGLTAGCEVKEARKK